MWLAVLLLLRVPLAPAWAFIAGLMAFVPNIGGVVALIGPAFAILFSGHDEVRFWYLLGLYAVIVVIDQLVLQPMLMKKATRVPIWASILVPIVLGIVIPFSGRSACRAAGGGLLCLPQARKELPPPNESA